MNREVILQAYDQGPEAVLSLFMETFTALEARIQELEPRTKKTPKTAISPRHQTGYKSRPQRVYAGKQDDSLADSPGTWLIPFTK